MPRRRLLVRRDDVRLPVIDDGPEAGPVVLCLHGFPQDATAFDGVRRRLTAEGLRVLVPNQRGYAPQARPRGRRPYAMAELVADALAVLDAAGVRAAHVVGHDWGGALAWALASRHRERVSGLTVLSTPHPRAMAGAMLRGQGLRSGYVALFQVPFLVEAVALSAGAAPMRLALGRTDLPTEAAERYVRRLQEPHGLSSALAWYRAMPLNLGYPVGPVRVPTSFLWGTDDPFFARASVLSTGSWVAAPFRSIEVPTGHWLPENEPTRVAQAVLAGVPGADPGAERTPAGQRRPARR